MRKHVFLSFLLAACFTAVRGQADSLTPMRRFIRVCNVYKRLPVALDILVERHANLVTNPGDSSRTSAVFSLHSDASYVEMGGMEQLVNDSLMLLVNRPTKRMIVYANHQAVADRFRQYLGFQAGDSSVLRLGRKYIATLLGSAGDTAMLEVKSLAPLPRTGLPNEEIRVRFHPNTDDPYEVAQVQRSLVSVNRETYEKASLDAEWGGKTVAIGDSAFFLVKEKTTVFRYRRISHDPDEKIPVRVGDRIAADKSGKYGPVNGFADYVLTQQF